MTTSKSTTKEQLDRIEKAIIGNGREGLLARTARIEERVDSAAKMAEETKEETEKSVEKAEKAVTDTKDLIVELKESITVLSTSVQAHHKSPHFAELLKKKEFWAVIVLGFVALHLISTYIPNLWDGIVALVGLPKLFLIPLY